MNSMPRLFGLFGSVVLLAGCATTGTVAGSGGEISRDTGGRTAEVGSALSPPTRPNTQALSAYKQARALMRDSPAQALAGLNAAIAQQPDFFEALNDKAWLLATTTDPQVRNPDQAFL